mmetsp:Transcript_24939/g.72155  ORF Transcript_24939/g.72155 Transcript_24939/m.72155 type:complete len:261 (-) Transcript_24939:493-1275(-)
MRRQLQESARHGEEPQDDRRISRDQRSWRRAEWRNGRAVRRRCRGGAGWGHFAPPPGNAGAHGRRVEYGRLRTELEAQVRGVVAEAGMSPGIGVGARNARRAGPEAAAGYPVVGSRAGPVRCRFCRRPAEEGGHREEGDGDPGGGREADQGGEGNTARSGGRQDRNAQGGGGRGGARGQVEEGGQARGHEGQGRGSAGDAGEDHAGRLSQAEARARNSEAPGRDATFAEVGGRGQGQTPLGQGDNAVGTQGRDTGRDRRA